MQRDISINIHIQHEIIEQIRVELIHECNFYLKDKTDTVISGFVNDVKSVFMISKPPQTKGFYFCKNEKMRV